MRKPTAKPTAVMMQHDEHVAHQVGRGAPGQHGRAGHGQGAEALDQALVQVLGRAHAAVLMAPKMTVCTKMPGMR